MGLEPFHRVGYTLYIFPVDGLTQRDRQRFALTFTPRANLESPVNLTPLTVFGVMEFVGFFCWNIWKGSTKVLRSELLMFIQHYFVALTSCHYNNTRFLLYLGNYSTNKQCLPMQPRESLL